MYRIIVNGKWMATGFTNLEDAIRYAENHYSAFEIVYCTEGRQEIVYADCYY